MTYSLHVKSYNIKGVQHQGCFVQVRVWTAQTFIALFHFYNVLSRILNTKTSNCNSVNPYPKSGLYQARREILHWSTLHTQPSRTQAVRRKLRDAQTLGDLDELRTVSVIVTTVSLSRYTHAILHLQQFLLSESIIAEKWLDYKGALNSWVSLFVSWVIKMIKQSFTLYEAQHLSRILCTIRQKSSIKWLKTFGFLPLITTENTWASKCHCTTCPALLLTSWLITLDT